ncbi:MAG TPA: hypothetical protein VID48_12435 [Solirubrobacteraceae bacterium]|jgi:hypothetical protein
MTGLISWLAIGIFAALAVWRLSGIALRVGGLLLFLGALFVTAETGWLPAALLAAVGGIGWLGGHWMYGVRHHYFDSPLARRLFLQVLPRRLDPTRRWGIPTVRVEPDRSPVRADGASRAPQATGARRV